MKIRENENDRNGWRKTYEAYSNYSGTELDVGIRDWEQRSRTFLKWMENMPKNSRILDCGCRIGTAGLILKENGFKNVTGIDIDEEIVRIASKFFEAHAMDCNDIKLDTNFDVILAMNLIEHLDFPEKFLGKVKKILNKDGILILSLPNEIWFRKVLDMIPKDPTHKQSWSIFSFNKFLDANGFKVLDMKPVGRIPFVLGCQTFMVLAKHKNKVNQ